MITRAKNVSVTVNAGGKAEVYASKAVNATVRAGGRIEIHGNPKQRDVKKSSRRSYRV